MFNKLSAAKIVAGDRKLTAFIRDWCGREGNLLRVISRSYQDDMILPSAVHATDIKSAAQDPGGIPYKNPSLVLAGKS